MKKSAGARAEDLMEESLVAELETALIEYVEKYGPTERAHRALHMSSLWAALRLKVPTNEDEPRGPAKG